MFCDPKKHECFHLSVEIQYRWGHFTNDIQRKISHRYLVPLMQFHHSSNPITSMVLKDVPYPVLYHYNSVVFFFFLQLEFDHGDSSGSGSSLEITHSKHNETGNVTFSTSATASLHGGKVRNSPSLCDNLGFHRICMCVCVLMMC